MITADTSVTVAAFARWHASHAVAREALRRADHLIAHVAVETYSVLTRLPPPRRVPPQLVVEFLGHYFPEPALALTGDRYLELLRLAAAQRVAGGAIYDALIATTAAAHQATLLTLDARAAGTYAAIGVDHRLLS